MLFDWETYLTFLIACIVVVIVPGPTVSVIIANSLRSGAKAGMANVAGTQLGLALLLMIVAFGLTTLVQMVGAAFFWLKLIGAAYLIWLGWSMLRADGRFAQLENLNQEVKLSRLFLQGFLVILSNPKGLFFFGAFIPQFVDPARDPFLQVLLLGGTFMVVATLLDGAYALLAGGAGQLLTKTRVGLLQKISGACLILGGVWMALSRR